MPLQNSGQISLNDLHVEAGGTSGTEASMNDSDIRGLLNASANSQMTFSSFYGASNLLLSIDITMGIYALKNLASLGYNNVGLSFGSISSTSVPFINNGNALIQSLYYTFNFSNYSLTFNVNNAGTDVGNSGWTSVNINGNTFNRTAFNHQGANGMSRWNLPNLSSSPFGTATTGDVVTVEFQ